mmetsp:Transcript_37629/g.80940  ORF Transcript_37629/g.80940 Transcript_37629/m.80940 type:complete len:260 (+) Transcript_37629:163-942(+)
MVLLQLRDFVRVQLKVQVKFRLSSASLGRQPGWELPRREDADGTALAVSFRQVNFIFRLQDDGHFRQTQGSTGDTWLPHGSRRNGRRPHQLCFGRWQVVLQHGSPALQRGKCGLRGSRRWRLRGSRFIDGRCLSLHEFGQVSVAQTHRAAAPGVLRRDCGVLGRFDVATHVHSETRSFFPHPIESFVQSFHQTLGPLFPIRCPIRVDKGIEHGLTKQALHLRQPAIIAILPEGCHTLPSAQLVHQVGHLTFPARVLLFG